MGMHRSGTSLLANCLINNGFSIGKTLNTDKNWQNPNGFFENDSFTDFYDRLLTYNNSTWANITRSKMQYTKEHVEEYRQLISNEFPNQEKILIKDPRSTFFKHFLKEVCKGLHDPYFLFCIRDKAECCTSLTRAQGLPYEQSEKLYDQTCSYFDIECLPINHHDVIHNNMAVIKTISLFCKIPLSVDTTDLVDMNLYRNRNTNA